MGGHIVRVGHTCEKPSPMQHTIGTIWACDCGRHWGLKPGSIWVQISLIERVLLNAADNTAAAAAAEVERKQIDKGGA
jgi:hypothetical protein